MENQVVPLLLGLESETLASAPEKVELLKANLQHQNHVIQSLKTRIKSQQKILKVKEAEFLQSDQYSRERYQNLEKELNQSQSICVELQAEIDRLRLEQIGRADEYDTKLQENSIRHIAETQEFENQLSNLIAQLKAAKICSQKIEESKIALEKEICHLENTVKLLNVSLAKKTHENEKMKQRLTEVVHRAKARIKGERDLLQRKSNSVISSLQEQVTVFQVENTKLNHSLATAEDQCSKLQKNNDDLSIRLQAAELRVNRITSDFEREKKVLISQSRTEFLATENEYQSKLEECRMKIKEAKRNLIGFVTQQFCSLFNVSEVIDESQFETFIHSVINRVRELLRIEVNLRGLLALGPKQSIEQAVSSLLLEREL
jgi:chromosome segregation ATPase